MRLNKFIAAATGRSRREADLLIAAGRVRIDGQVAILGARIDETETRVTVDDQKLALPTARTLIMLNKPVGYVSSRRAQAKNARTLYELLPPELRRLKTVGRLDRDSSGLILLTDDGDLAFQMTHPSFRKNKVYLVWLDKPLAPPHEKAISDSGVKLPDGPSRLELTKLDDQRQHWRIQMSEGRNRQIRRTFAALGYNVTKLHRIEFGDYRLGDLAVGQFRFIRGE